MISSGVRRAGVFFLTIFMSGKMPVYYGKFLWF
jgi:hypothetical protein